MRQPRRALKKEFTRKLPVPDPTPDAPEPIREPEIDPSPECFPSDVDCLIGTPTPPPGPGFSGGTAGAAPGPLLAGVGSCTNPVRIEESYVKPEYPEMARVARVEANVILRAVIECDGSVGEIEVLRCSQPGFGFEEAATNAAAHWRYEPARQNGTPVSVYFSIFVDFSIASLG
jgi:protein TonB